jgi:hypothetical protein
MDGGMAVAYGLRIDRGGKQLRAAVHKANLGQKA